VLVPEVPVDGLPAGGGVNRSTAFPLASLPRGMDAG
jgi:hypothetical protein